MPAMGQPKQSIAYIPGLYLHPNRTLIAEQNEFTRHEMNVFNTACLSAQVYTQNTPKGSVEHSLFIAANTLEMMREMSSLPAFKRIPPKSVWEVTKMALASPNSSHFFTNLRACNALTLWFPELEKLWGIPNPSLWHPEIDTGLHTMMVLQRANQLSNNIAVRYAALVHDLGKALTDTTQWPSHHGHDDLGLQAIENCSSRIGVPFEFTQLALLVSAHHSKIHRLNQQSPHSVLALLGSTNAFTHKENFENMLLVCQADFQGRKGFLNRAYPQVQQWLTLLSLCHDILRPLVTPENANEYINTHAQIRLRLHQKIDTYLQQNFATQLLS